jgi:ubiquinone/menaquinone biosynthesis C-methylase UbiE
MIASRCLASLVVALASLGPVAFAQEQSVRPGINERFLAPDVDVDEWVERFEGESREVFDERERIVKELKLKPGMAVADIGAGTGLFTRLFAKEVGREGKVYAVDIAPKMIEYIKETSKELDLPQIKPILGKDHSAQLPKSSVDLVYICDTYHHFEFPTKMMKSIHQALKPKGRVALVDFVRIEGESSEWTLEHVRAGQEVFEKEIMACGFKKVREVEGVLEENYFVVFEKVESNQSDSSPGAKQPAPSVDVEE